MNEKEIQIKLSKEISRLYRECQFKKCIFPDQSNCSKKVIKAHSIQKNKILNRIAENGMLISADAQNTLFTKEFEKIGVRSTSTFFGFCNYHDTNLFSEIENKEHKGSIEQNFLHAYRACALEYVKKKVSVCFYEKAMKKYKNNPCHIFDSYSANSMVPSICSTGTLTVSVDSLIAQPTRDDATIKTTAIASRVNTMFLIIVFVFTLPPLRLLS